MQKSTLERAFELARAGSCRSLNDIRRTLKKEGHESVDGHLAGRVVRGQLTTALRDRVA